MKYVEIRNHKYGIVALDKDGNETSFTPIGKAIYVKDICRNIENGCLLWQLQFRFKGRPVVVDFPRGSITDKMCLKSLIEKGADIKPRKADIAIDSILCQEDSIKTVTLVYENLGWIPFETSDGMVWGYRADTLVGKECGRYLGDYCIKKAGTFEAWRNMVLNEVIGHDALVIVLLASLAAVVNGLIASTTTGENPIFHICYASGKGKSTAGYVACSVFGEPFEGGRVALDDHGEPTVIKSLFGTWSSTENAVIATHNGNHGMVAILNELGKFAGNDLTSVVYALSDGADKARLNEHYRSFVGEGFSTTILSIGESSLIEKCKTKESGIATRVMEIEEALTESAEHSRALKEGSRANNGWAAPLLAEYIIDNGGEEFVRNKYIHNLRALSVNISDSKKHRFVEKFTALLITTAELAKEALSIPFDCASIISFCDAYWEKKCAEEGSICQSFYKIIEECDVHSSNFYNDNFSFEPRLAWGRITSPSQIVGNRMLVHEYIIRPSIVKDLLNNHGYQNPTTQLKKWRDLGVLSHEAGRLTSKRRIKRGSKEEHVYVLQVWENIPPQGGEDNG